MSFLNIHKKRHNLSPNFNGLYNGQLESNTENFIMANFDKSICYQEVMINDVKVGVRFLNDKNYSQSSPYEQKKLMFKPNSLFNNGSYIKFYNSASKREETWLLMYFETNIMYPKGYIRFCNKEISFNDKTYPCVVDTKISTTSDVDEKKDLVLPLGYLLIYVPYDDNTKNISEGTRFIIDNQSYEVQTINITSLTFNEVGLVELNVKKVPKNAKELLDTNEDNEKNNNEEELVWGITKKR